MFTLRPTVHSNPKKTLFKPEEFENVGFFVIVCTGKHFENGAYGNYGVNSLTEFSSNRNLK